MTPVCGAILLGACFGGEEPVGLGGRFEVDKNAGSSIIRPKKETTYRPNAAPARIRKSEKKTRPLFITVRDVLVAPL